MTPQQIYQLIWLPGLSTAEKVTEVSGRGVGMDIVRSKIDELNGAVEVESEPGQGTTFTIKLPLTLAILPSLMVEIDGDVFAVPLESVIEIVRVGRQRHDHGARAPWPPLRDRVVSILRLGSVFNWRHGRKQTDTDESDSTTLVIIGEGRPATRPGRGRGPWRRRRGHQVHRRQLSQRCRHCRGQHPRRRPRFTDPRSAHADRNVIRPHAALAGT